MIEVLYHRERHRLTVKGHAGSGEKGHDLVCAAASILAYTLGQAVIQSSVALDKVIKLEEGDAEISCTPQVRFKNTLTLVFDTICTGFDILAQQYPENIKYSVLG